MHLYYDFKELSAWIIGIASLLILLVLVYTRMNKENPQS